MEVIMHRDMDYNELPQLAVDFINYMLTIKGKSPSTVSEYFYDLRTFFRFIKLHKKIIANDAKFDSIDVRDIGMDIIRSITLSDLYSFISYVSTKRDNTSPSRARKVACLRSFFKYLHKKAGVMDSNPAMELESPKLTKKLPKYLDLDESKSLLNIVDGEFKERDLAILVLFLNCGLRLSELVGIDMNKIKGDTLNVVGKGSKERTIYLNGACLNAISNYLKVRPVDGVKDRQALFLSKRRQRISSKTVQYLVKKYIDSAGLDSTRYSVHKLRHTAATLMYKHGNVDIRALQSILGHQSISTTEIYTHVDNAALRKAVDSNPLSGFQPDRGTQGS
jgi:site-specific recombinase XerD